MQPAKINDRELLRLIDKGLSQTEAARTIGVSRQAVHARLQELRGLGTKAVVATKRAGKVAGKLDSLAQLKKINTDANWLLDHLMKWAKGDPEAIQILERQLKVVRIGKDEMEVREVRFKDPRALAVQVMAEIRGQLDLQLEIFKTLYSIQTAEEFMNTVLEVIGEVNPDVRREIINRLNRRRAVREAVRFS